MSSILNGVRWTEKRLTDEQLLLLEDAEKRALGCLKCDGMSIIKEDDLQLKIFNDFLVISSEFDAMNVQITYCPFCGKKL